MTSPHHPPTPKLPSRKTGAMLASAMLAVGIALGALIGPGPASSLASSQRAAAIGRVLALLALGSGTSSGGDLLLSSGATHPPASSPQPTPSTMSEAHTGGGASGAAGSASSTPHPSTSSPSASTNSPTKPAAGEEEESEKTPKAKPLPPIADAWVIELPYGASLENALKQSAAAPYLDGQLKGSGTALGGYTSLAAAQLAGAATLLSGQVGANVTTVAPPPCATANATGSTTPGTPGSTPGTTPSATPSAPASGTGQPSTGTPCPVGEPAGVQSANAFLQEVVPKIEASPAYKEHGLIVITFATAGQQAGAPSATTSPTEGGTEVAYPAGSLTSTLTAAGSPAGALLLSPFLRHPGKQSASAFNPLAPHESLEALLRPKAPS